jgi:hypothetical protein
MHFIPSTKQIWCPFPGLQRLTWKTLYFTLVLEGFDVFPVTIELLSSIDILSYDVITLICNVHFFDSHNRCLNPGELASWVTKSLETSAFVHIGVKCIDRTNSTLFGFLLIIILMFCYPRYLKSYFFQALKNVTSHNLFFFSKANFFNNSSLICL